jgi:hypothetical protein
MAQLPAFYVRPVADFDSAAEARAAYQKARDTFVQAQPADNSRGLAIVRCNGTKGSPCVMKWARPFVLPSQDDFNLKTTLYNDMGASRQASGHRTTTTHTKNLITMKQSKHHKRTETSAQWPPEEVAVLKNLSTRVNVDKLPSLSGPLEELEKFNKGVYDGFVHSHNCKCSTKRKASQQQDHDVASTTHDEVQAEAGSDSGSTAAASAQHHTHKQPSSSKCRTDPVISCSTDAPAAAHLTVPHEARVVALEKEVRSLRVTVDTLCRMSRLGQLTSHRAAAAASESRGSNAQANSEESEHSAVSESEDEEESLVRAHPHMHAAYEVEQEEKHNRNKRRKQGEQDSRWRALPSQENRTVAQRITARNLYTAHKDV